MRNSNAMKYRYLRLIFECCLIRSIQNNPKMIIYFIKNLTFAFY